MAKEFDLETGLNNIPLATSEKGEPHVQDSSSQTSPDEISRDVQPARDGFKGIYDSFRGRDQKTEIRYKSPPKKGERSELEIFQNLVGIHFLRPGGGELHPGHQGRQPASPMHDIFMPTKAARRRWRNRGLYDRSLAQDTKNRVLYGMSTYVISFLYLLQILIAAALTGLSAYQQTSSVALTTLGAINTVLAGILAWLNGQGMPTRYRRARDQYREVVRAIEDTERTFAEIDYIVWDEGTNPRPNAFLERDRLEQMYEDARQDQERNYPDIQEGPNKAQMENEAEGMKDTIKAEKNKAGQFFKELEDTKAAHMSQLKKLEETIAARIQKALQEQAGHIRKEVEYEHLQKKAAEYEARLRGEEPPREQKSKPSRAAEKAKDALKPRSGPREAPHEGPRDGPREGPRGGLHNGPHNGPGEGPREGPREVPREGPQEGPHGGPRNGPREGPRGGPRAKSPSRSPARSPAKSPARPPLRSLPGSPTRQAKSPTRSPARSPPRTARSPSRSPARPPPGSRRPSSSSSSDSGDEPGPRGPPGLFTNTPRGRGKR